MCRKRLVLLILCITLSLELITALAGEDGMIQVQAVVLAAGKSTRFGPHFNKLLMPLYGKPLITHSTDVVDQCGITVTVVLGHMHDKIAASVTERVPEATFVYQEEQRGTGHALLCSRSTWHRDNILVLNGDMPLLTAELIMMMITRHQETNAAVTFVVATPDTTEHAYGRVLTDEGSVRIVEARDFTGDVTKKYPINAGIYLFKRSFLERHIEGLDTQNAQRQLYITDLIGIASQLQLGVTLVECAYEIVRGVNTMTEFLSVQDLLRARIMLTHLEQGVHIEDCATTWIDSTVKIGVGTRIAPGVQIRGNTAIGVHCTLGAHTIIENSVLAESVVLHPYTLVHDSVVPAGAIVGPFVQIQRGELIDTKTGSLKTRPMRRIKKASTTIAAYEL